jgi:predicted adenylyl cyclase CyaB
MAINIEIKARTAHAAGIRNYLLENGAEFRGIDQQLDTYFRVPQGRLKLRQGNIENALISYKRNNESGPRQSEFNLLPVADGNDLKLLLERALGIIAVVKKQREIYYIDNVKFHIDFLESLGEFVEIEATDQNGARPVDNLRQQCEFYMRQFSIRDADLVNVSYSDMLLPI